MMYHRLVYLFGVVLVALWGQAAVAASVSLTTTTPTIDMNAQFDVQLSLEATANDVKGPHPGNFCGEVRIDYDPRLLTFVSSAGALQQLDEGVETLEDGREARTFRFDDFSFDSSPDEGVVGMFRFEATGALGPASIGIADAAAIGVADGFQLGSFANHAGSERGITPSEFFPEFNGASIQVAQTPPPVPLPAAAWLMLSALGVLGLFGRKSRAANRIA